MGSRDLLFVLGTRPEIIKLAPVIRLAERDDDLSLRLLHTGQHYDDELSDTFFRDLQLPDVSRNLDVGSGRQGEQTAAGIQGIESDILEHDPDAVIALGDTNAVLSAAIATSKVEPPFVHIEAGIRSFDRAMPEEVNRVLADHVADLAFAPTEQAVDNLADEGIRNDVWIVGNPIVDACLEHVVIAGNQSNALDRLGLGADEFAVVTIHRQRNTDDHKRFAEIVEALNGQEFPVIFPIHPRTREAMAALDIDVSNSLRLVDPLDYLDFLELLNNARIVVTDSGGIQEEASVLEVPCITVRPNTERPETVDAGVNRLVEPSALGGLMARIFADSGIRDSMTGHPELYGDGKAADRIVSILKSELP